MFRPVNDRLLSGLLAMALTAVSAHSLAEQGDRDKPIQIEADRASLDQLRALRSEIQGEEAVTSRGTIFDRAMVGAMVR